MFGYTPYQPYGLLQVIPTLWSITSHITPINTHTHNGLACKVCTTQQAQSQIHTASLWPYKVKRTHKGRDFEKRCRGQVSIDIFLKQSNRKKFRSNNRENGRNKSHGQPIWNAAKYLKIVRKTLTLPTLVMSTGLA